MRWYLSYGLSHRDVEEVLAERGVVVDHVTISSGLPVGCAQRCSPHTSSSRSGGLASTPGCCFGTRKGWNPALMSRFCPILGRCQFKSYT